MTEVLEKPAKPHNCATDGPPHQWEVVVDDKGDEKKQTPEQAKKEKAEQAKEFRERDREREAKAAAMGAPKPDPRYEKDAQDLDFESKAITKNEEKKKIAACEVEYKCKNCPENTKVDIVFEDGQLGECQNEKARNYDTDKRKSKQAKKLVDIQRQINEQRKTNHKPMAKFNNDNIGDAALADRSATRRGLQFENVK